MVSGIFRFPFSKSQYVDFAIPKYSAISSCFKPLSFRNSFKMSG